MNTDEEQRSYLSSLVSYTLKYPLNGWYIEMNVVRQIETLDCQSILNMVCVPLKGKKKYYCMSSKFNTHCVKLAAVAVILMHFITQQKYLWLIFAIHTNPPTCCTVQR